MTGTWVGSTQISLDPLPLSLHFDTAPSVACASPTTDRVMTSNNPTTDIYLPALEKILAGFELKAASITPLALPWYNNFIFRVDLAVPAVPAAFPSPPQPGTSAPPPDGVSVIVIRFSNAQARGTNNVSRVENLAAAQCLAREALLTKGLPPLVPAVYAWGSRKPDVEGPMGLGWVLDEWRSGRELVHEWAELPWEDKLRLLGDLADVFAAIQGLILPRGVKKFGGLKFDGNGDIVDGEMPVLEGAPWESYAEVWVAKLRAQLKASEKEGSVLRGWREDGVREKLEQFLDGGGVERMLDGVDIHKRALVHSDFCAVDPSCIVELVADTSQQHGISSTTKKASPSRHCLISTSRTCPIRPRSS